MDPLIFQTFSMMNRPVYLAGLSSMQWYAFMAVFFILIISTFAMGIMAMGIGLVVMGVPMYFLIMKVWKENKKGNPDYLTSALYKRINSTNLVDEMGFVKYLIRDKK